MKFCYISLTKLNHRGSQKMDSEEYYINLEGLMVLTEKFLKERGYCCENNCKHCPYGYKKEQ